MRATRFKEERIVEILKAAEAGIDVHELCRKHGICEATFYNWKAKYGGLTLNEVRRLKLLEQENSRLKHLVAEQALDIQALKAVVSKNF